MRKGAAIVVWFSVWVSMLVLGASTARAQAPKQGGTLQVSLWVEHAHLDTRTTVYQLSSFLLGNIHSSLVRLDKDLKPTPDLADRWEMKDGGKTWLFYLRPEVKFHDGTPADATAVKWNFDWLVNNPGWKQPYLIDVLAGVDAINPTTVRFNLKGPIIDFDRFLSMTGSQYHIVSPAAVQKYGDDYKKHPVGSGPFRFVEWVSGSHVTVERNPDYFRKGFPYLDKVVWKIVTAPLTNVTLMRTGQLDIVGNAPSKTLPLLETVPNTQVLTGPHVRWAFAPLNLEKPPFNDLRVRQAIGCYGIDRQAIAKIAYNGLAKPLVSFLAPDAEDYVDLNGWCPYDPEKAKMLLREAGVKDLRYSLITSNSDEVFVDIGLAMQSQLQKIGVTVKFEILETATFYGRLGKREYEQGVEDMLPFPSMIGHLPYFHPKGARHSGWPAEDLTPHNLMTKWRFATTRDEKKRYAREYQEYIAKNMYWVNVTSSPYFEGVRRQVRDYYFTNGLQMWLERTWLDR